MVKTKDLFLYGKSEVERVGKGRGKVLNKLLLFLYNLKLEKHATGMGEFD